MKNLILEFTPLAVSEGEPVAVGAQLARIVDIDPDGAISVAFADGPAITARLLDSVSPAALRDAYRSGIQVLVVGVRSAGSAPVIVGIVRERLPELVDCDVARNVIEAAEEIVLRCGKASVTLRADGKISIKGESILSRASGVHKVQGGSVRIN